MTEYTPHESALRLAYLRERTTGTAHTMDAARAEFDRFLARVRRDAWAEGARAMVSGASTEWIDRENPYKTEGQT